MAVAHAEICQPENPDGTPSARLRAGLRWAILEDAVVLVAPVEEGPGRLRLMYRSTGFGAGVFDAAVKDGVIRAVLSNGSKVILKPEGEGRITWTSSDGSRSVEGTLARGRDDP